MTKINRGTPVVVLSKDNKRFDAYYWGSNKRAIKLFKAIVEDAKHEIKEYPKINIQKNFVKKLYPMLR